MRLNDLHWYATAAFGLEGIVSAELKRLRMRDVQAESGGARFTGSPADAFRACLWLRSADRVLLILADREARTFEELFQLVKSIAWEELLPGLQMQIDHEATDDVTLALEHIAAGLESQNLPLALLGCRNLRESASHLHHRDAFTWANIL